MVRGRMERGKENGGSETEGKGVRGEKGERETEEGKRRGGKGAGWRDNRKRRQDLMEKERRAGYERTKERKKGGRMEGFEG